MGHDYNVGRLLFDRLTDLDPAYQTELRPARSLDRAGLMASVRRELENLFNTRVPLSIAELDGRPRTVLEYGVPDFSTFSPRNPDDCARMAECLRLAIEAYEPRLAQVEVEIEAATDRQDMQARIDGVLVVDEVREPVSFPTIFHQWRARVGLGNDKANDG